MDNNSKITLAEKCEAMKASTNYIVEPNTYLILHLDGRGFSKRIKKVFKRPFDEKFVDAMNETMLYLLKNIQGALIGYVQSDEITIILSDKSDDQTKLLSPFFNYRLNKIQSISASMCGAKFNRIMFSYLLDEVFSEAFDTIGCQTRVNEICNTAPLYSFDCKAFPAKEYNDAYCWLLYRKRDCIKNSCSQVAQTYIPHKKLVGLHSEERIELLKKEKGIDWYEDYPDGLKYGRFGVYTNKTLKNEDDIEYERNVWELKEGKLINDGDFKDYIINQIRRREIKTE